MAEEWLTIWKTPGLCLVARLQVRHRGLFGMMTDPLMHTQGMWLLVQNSEALLLDCPFAHSDANQVLNRLDEFLRDEGAHLKYITVSQLHQDHAAGLSATLERYPEATFVYPRAWPQRLKKSFFERMKAAYRPSLQAAWTRQPHEAYDGRLPLELGGEPVLLWDVPMLSPTDQVLCFRGVAVVPNWPLTTDPEHEISLIDVPLDEAAASLARLANTESEANYTIHTWLPTRGDAGPFDDWAERLSATQTIVSEKQQQVHSAD